MTDTQTKTITEADRLTLIGLATVAERLNEQLRLIVLTARTMTGDKEYGHTEDMIYAPAGPPVEAVDRALKNMGISVAPEGTD